MMPIDNGPAAPTDTQLPRIPSSSGVWLLLPIATDTIPLPPFRLLMCLLRRQQRRVADRPRPSWASGLLGRFRNCCGFDLESSSSVRTPLSVTTSPNRPSTAGPRRCFSLSLPDVPVIHPPIADFHPGWLDPCPVAVKCKNGLSHQPWWAIF